MNKYQEKLDRIHARRMSVKQRVVSGIFFVVFILLSYLTAILGYGSILRINNHYTNNNYSDWINLVVFIINTVFLLVIVYLCIKFISIGLKKLIMAISGIKENDDDFSIVFKEDELHDNWVLLDKSESKYFTKELTSELSKKHVLYKKQYNAIARYEGRDDVLFQVKTSEHPLYVVHLTFGGREKDPSWPGATAFDSKSDFTKNCQIE